MVHSPITIVAVRFAERAEDLGWMRGLAEHPGTKVLLVNKGKPLELSNVTVVDTENICRESFGYLWALNLLPVQRGGTLVFTQAKLKLADPRAFERWIAAIRLTQHDRPADAPCFSYFGGVVPGTVHRAAIGSNMPYMFGATNGPAGGAFRSSHYRSKHICADEDWKQWTSSTFFGPGGTFAVSLNLVQSLPETLRQAALDELRASYSPRSRVCLMEYVFERSWGRLWTQCNMSVPACVEPPPRAAPPPPPPALAGALPAPAWQSHTAHGASGT